MKYLLIVVFAFMFCLMVEEILSGDVNNLLDEDDD